MHKETRLRVLHNGIVFFSSRSGVRYLKSVFAQAEVLPFHEDMLLNWETVLLECQNALLCNPLALDSIGFIASIDASGDPLDTNAENMNLVDVTLSYVIGLIASYHEFSLVPRAYPWAALKLLCKNPIYRAQGLEDVAPRIFQQLRVHVMCPMARFEPMSMLSMCQWINPEGHQTVVRL